MEGHWDSCIKDIAGLKNAVFVETIITLYGDRGQM